MLRYCCRASNEFKLRDILLQNSPVYDDGEVRVYCSRRIEQIDTDKLVYFAASVFWRAAVERWRVDSTRLDEVELGSNFTEQFRRFLLLDGDFPEHAAITTEVFESHEPSLGTAVFPGGGRVDEYHLYRFAIPGIRFKLFVGRRIPEEARRMCTWHSPEKFVMLTKGSLIEEVAGTIGRKRALKFLSEQGWSQR